MLIYFSDYLATVAKHQQINQVGKLLKMIVIMMIFLLYHSIEGFQEANQPKSKFQRTIDQMQNNFAAKICLKYSFGLIFQLFKFIVQNFQQEALNVICPIFYFFASYQNIAGYFFENFNNFLPIIKKLQILLMQKFEEMNQKLMMSEATIHESFQTELFSSDKDLLGFIPLNTFFSTQKTQYKTSVLSAEQQSVSKLFVLREIIEKFNDYLNVPSKDLNLEQYGNCNNKAKEFEQAFQVDDKANLPDKSKMLIVLDGQNVAMRHGEMNQQFSSRGLEIVYEY
eukprot:TRINITY_DN7926_c0_g1_i1.p1 TRINITY_DN7926_c0_g1~~TRINITY_DN7926_c0_g1_i1.p1  ORF type:complete len:282 (-),score=40.13 TRINITY_DN7926_c0_g1_i1:498-1343(-)